MDVRTIQRSLKSLGFDPGPIDGVTGPLTRHAIRNFQISAKIGVDGIYGPQTDRALREALAANAGTGAVKAPAPSGVEPPWLAWAREQKGIHERRDASTVLSWLQEFAGWVTSPSTAWCGAFMGMAIGQTLPDEPIPSNPLGARQWLKFGREMREPVPGAVTVFWRGSPNDWRGHVGIVVGRDQRNNLMILGGNQGDTVNIRPFARNRLLGFRWPKDYPMPEQRGLPILTSDGRVSTNES